MRRIRQVVAKPGELVARWGRPDAGESPDICYAWGADGASKPDALILSEALEEAHVYDGTSLRTELERRGYDITTLKFSIKQKSTPTGKE